MERKLVELGDKLNLGFITRREFLRRAAIITGSWAASAAALQACAPVPAPTTAPATQAQAATNTAVPPTKAPAAPTPTAGPKTGGTFITARNADASALDPQLEPSQARMRMTPLIYNGLVTLGTDLSVQPDLAQSWEVKEDGKLIVFKLRHGVQWHPPFTREFTADDVKYSFGRLLKDSPGKADFAVIQDVEVVDKYTAPFHLSTPNAGILASMAGTYYPAIVCKDAVEKYGDLKKSTIGTGPFILDQWVLETETRLRKNPDYFIKGQPYVYQVVLKVIPEESSIVAALRGNTIQHAILEDNKNFDLLKNEKTLTSYRGSRLGYQFVNINHKLPPYDKPQVAQAISWAVDRAEIIQACTQGYAVLTAPATPPMKLWQLSKEKWEPFY